MSEIFDIFDVRHLSIVGPPRPTPIIARHRDRRRTRDAPGTPWERLQNGLGTPALYGVRVFMGQPTTTAVADMSVGAPRPSAQARSVNGHVDLALAQFAC
jgi:hypothetical protein